MSDRGTPDPSKLTTAAIPLIDVTPVSIASGAFCQQFCPLTRIRYASSSKTPRRREGATWLQSGGCRAAFQSRLKLRLQFKVNILVLAPTGVVSLSERSLECASKLARPPAADNFCDPKTKLGNMSCKGVDGVRCSDLECQRVAAGNPKSRTSLPAPVARRRFRLSRVCHHDASAARAQLFR